MGAKKALEILHSAGYEAYLVGGCVRDAVMGNEINDFDITTSATPEEMKLVFENEHIFETGIKHGTITFVYNHENVEITTYRVDGEYIDNRHPESVEFTKSLENDLKRRDFTMNAIVYNDKQGFVDMFGGMNDISSKIIRAIGEPQKRFREDALRILRAVRFSSTLGFEIEPKTREAMLECKALLHHISKERIAVEINKMLLGKNVKNAILENYEILGEIIPELTLMHGFEQKNPWHIYDVLTHTAYVVENTPPKLHLRLSALLHDTGKVHTFTTDANGVGHFYGHGEKSTEIAQKYLNDYKYDNATKEKVVKLVKIHDLRFEQDKLFVKKQLNRLGTERFFDLLDLQRADNLAQNPERARGEHIDTLEQIANDILSENECLSLKTLAVNGSDLIKDGHSAGKNLGIILNTLLAEVLEEKLPNEKNTLLKRAQELKMEKELEAIENEQQEQQVYCEEIEENENELVELDEQVENDDEEYEQDDAKQYVKPKMPKKKKAMWLLIIIASLLVIMIPLTILVNSCYEQELEKSLNADAIIFANLELAERYGDSKSFFFEYDTIKIHYQNEDASIFETKIPERVDLVAYDEQNKKYNCTVYLNGETAADWIFENYVE